MDKRSSKRVQQRMKLMKLQLLEISPEENLEYPRTSSGEIKGDARVNTSSVIKSRIKGANKRKRKREHSLSNCESFMSGGEIVPRAKAIRNKRIKYVQPSLPLPPKIKPSSSSDNSEFEIPLRKRTNSANKNARKTERTGQNSTPTEHKRSLHSMKNKRKRKKLNR